VADVGRIDRPLPVRGSWTIGPEELRWRFSRSSGPGGQGVNTADSRVELSWSPAESPSLLTLADPERTAVLERLMGRIVNGNVTIAVSDHRAQLRNRETARLRLQRLLQEALRPAPTARRSSRPTRGSVERRLAGKKARSAVKTGRGRPPVD